MANETMREHWTSATGPHWVEHQRLFDRMIEPFGRAALEALDVSPDHHVLDVGCGTGSTSIALAELARRVTGADISETMIEAARTRSAHVDFIVRDAQTDDLGGPYDLVYSRFGVMFFDDPVAAFANIRQETPHGRMTFACWRTAAENPVITAGAEVILSELPVPPPPADPFAPGPFAFADPDRVRSVLDQSGWVDVEIEPFDTLCRFDLDGGDGVEERLILLLGSFPGAAMREQLSSDRHPAVLDRVREHLHGLRTDGVLQLPGAIWVVSAGSDG